MPEHRFEHNADFFEVFAESQLYEKAVNDIIRLCRRGWERRLLAGFNGNASMRIGDTCLITRSGTAKGSLGQSDFAVLSISDGSLLYGSFPSSESPMHLALYREQEKAIAIMHCHPPHMLALGILLPELSASMRLDMPVFEAWQLRQTLGEALDHAPGSNEVAFSVAQEAKNNEAVWMEKHGLVTWGGTLDYALALSEELDHLANIRLLSFQSLFSA